MKKRFLLVALCAALFSGCVFSWKPNVSDSNISVSDKTTVEVLRENEKEK